MNPEAQEEKSLLTRFFQSAAGVKVTIALIGVLFGSSAIRIFSKPDSAGADTARFIADSTVKANLIPVVQQMKRQDTALMRIFFRQDVQMSDAQKLRADSLMRAALQNINYGKHE